MSGNADQNDISRTTQTETLISCNWNITLVHSFNANLPVKGLNGLNPSNSPHVNVQMSKILVGEKVRDLFRPSSYDAYIRIMRTQWKEFIRCMKFPHLNPSLRKRKKKQSWKSWHRRKGEGLNFLAINHLNFWILLILMIWYFSTGSYVHANDMESQKPVLITQKK